MRDDNELLGRQDSVVEILIMSSPVDGPDFYKDFERFGDLAFNFYLRFNRVPVEDNNFKEFIYFYLFIFNTRSYFFGFIFYVAGLFDFFQN